MLQMGPEGPAAGVEIEMVVWAGCYRRLTVKHIMPEKEATTEGHVMHEVRRVVKLMDMKQLMEKRK